MWGISNIAHDRRTLVKLENRNPYDFSSISIARRCSKISRQGIRNVFGKMTISSFKDYDFFTKMNMNTISAVRENKDLVDLLRKQSEDSNTFVHVTNI